MKSKKMRDSAKGEACTLNIAQVCNHNSETVVYAHLPDESGGMGKKSDDISGCYACSSCHSMLDGHTKPTTEFAEFKDWYMRRAMVRTWRRLIGKEIVIIKGLK